MLVICPARGTDPQNDWFLPFVGQDAVLPLRGGATPFWSRAALEAAFPTQYNTVAIGQWHSQDCWSVQVEPAAVDPLQHIQGSLYTLLGRLPDGAFSAWSRALQLQLWLRDHQYCGRCGQRTQLADRSRGLRCEGCEHISYPRLSPCVIVAVTRGDQILLAAANQRRASFYSTLAGFIEPGESAEQAVAREVKEEVGVDLKNIRYFDSQPWPFPGQLMLGFFAEYAGGELIIDTEELSDAGWFKADDLPPIPPETSISGRLIRTFCSHHQH